MQIKKWGFLLSYSIYLVFCMLFALVSHNGNAVNSMMFAISIATAAFALADLVSAKIDIDRRDREVLIGFVHSTNLMQKDYSNRIKAAYAEHMKKARTKAEEETQEGEGVKAGVDDNSSEGLGKVAENVEKPEPEESDSLKTEEPSAEEQSVETEANPDDEFMKQVSNLLESEKSQSKLAAYIAVFGFSALLIILTMRINVPERINHAAVIIAFLVMMMNLIVKDRFRSESIEKLTNKGEEQ